MADMAEHQCAGPRGRNDVTATISLGSNASDARCRVAQAIAELASRYCLTAATEIYITNDIGMIMHCFPLKAKARYANAIVKIDMPAAPLAAASAPGMNAALKELERNLGRLKEHKAAGLVNIDLDLVTEGRRILRLADYLRPYYFPGVLSL